LARGQAILPLVLVFVLVLGIIAATLAAAAFIQTQLSGQRAFVEQARQAAQGGVNDALIRIARDKTWTATTDISPCSGGTGYPVSSGNVTACVKVMDTSTISPPRTRRTIEATATVRNVTRKLRVEVEVSPSGALTILSREERTN
jgi:type II secretory pathway component PulK